MTDTETPLVDCHRHLGGAMPTSFVWRTIQQHNLSFLAETENDVQKQMTFASDEPRQFHRFLDKFKILDEIPWTEQLIDEAVFDVCAEIKAEGLDYVWMTCSINKFMKLKWHKHQAIRFLHDAFDRYCPGQVGLILSLKYESMRAGQKRHAKLIEHPDACECLIGLDLVGDENYYDANFYAPIFEEWNKAGKMTRAHVGESQSIDNIETAITKLHVTNIAHGFKIIDSERLISIAKDAGISFDLAITSNYLTGTWVNPRYHPMAPMMQAGLRVTLGSDDPVQCSTNLQLEFNAARALGVSQEFCEQAKRNAIENVAKWR